MIINTFDEYQRAARRTQNENLQLWQQREHALYGLASEVGEVLGIHQKIHQGHPMDEAALQNEIGDVMWFVAELCDVYGWHMSEIATLNIDKLRERYPVRFTVEYSLNRKEYKRNRMPAVSGYANRVKGERK